MSQFINTFRSFQNFPQELKQDIQNFHVFDHTSLRVAYCVTNDDKVYGFGGYVREYLGYNEFNENMSYVLIQELCDKRIEQFFGLFNLFFARSETNEIYSWGKNDHGLLGRGFQSNQYLTPRKFQFFADKNIIEISCSHSHCLALSYDRVVYGWGSNKRYKIDCNSEEKVILEPIVLCQLSETIKSIVCSDYNSFGLTFSGRIYCFNEEKYMDWETPGEEIIDFFAINRYPLKSDIYCQTNGSLYCRKNEDWIQIDNKNPFEYFFQLNQTTYKTIHLKNSEIFSIDFNSRHKESNELKKTFESIDFNESKLTISSTIFRDIPKTLKSEVKCFFKSSQFEFLVMSDNKVFVIGMDMFGQLGLGNIHHAHVLTEIKELSVESIDNFFNGYFCIYARNEKGHIFSWGWNEQGQLGRGYKCPEFNLKPERNEHLANKNIIEIVYNYNICLALSSDGKVYSWGSNEDGQVGCGESAQGDVLVPFMVDFEVPIKSIACIEYTSLAVDIDGNGFYWGKPLEEVIQWIPMKMFVQEVKKIQKIDDTNEALVLKESGNVFIYSFVENNIIFEIIIDFKVTDIYDFWFETEECLNCFDYETKVSEKQISLTILNTILRYIMKVLKQFTSRVKKMMDR